MRYKVFVCLLEDKDISAATKCAMIMKTEGDQSHVRKLAHLVEANNIGELRKKIIDEIDVQMGYLPGMVAAGACLGDIKQQCTPVIMGSLQIASDDSAGKINDTFIDLEK